MLQVILYFFLNFTGFFVFLAIWNRLPKPKPFDYTTIPGMKLKVSNADEIPELVQFPGESVNKEFRGNFNEIKKKFSNFQELLDFLNMTYGPLSSFWWSSRYVVVVSDENFVRELKNFKTHLVAVSPFAIGSYLHAHPAYCTTLKVNTLKIRSGTQEIVIDRLLSEAVQNRLLFDLDFSEGVTDHCDGAKIIENLKQAKVQVKHTRNSLRRPLMVVFDEEIWVDAHPIPKYCEKSDKKQFSDVFSIPIIIHTSEIIRNWPDDELFTKFYAQFYWLPGFQLINDKS